MNFAFVLIKKSLFGCGKVISLNEHPVGASDNRPSVLARTLRIRHVGLAFLWACTLLTFRSSVLLCSCIDTMSFATLVVMTGLACQGLVMISIAALGARNPGLIDRLPAWAFVCLALAGLAVMSLVGHVGYEGSRAASIGGSICAGCSYGYLCSMWAQTYGRMHPARTSFYLPIVFLVTFVIYFAVTFVSEALDVQATLLMIPLPVLALWCLRAERDDVDVRDAASAEQDVGEVAYFGAFRSLWRLLLGAAIFAFMYGFVWQLAVAAVGSVNVAHRTPLVISFVVGLAYATATDQPPTIIVAVSVVAVYFVVLWLVMARKRRSPIAGSEADLSTPTEAPSRQVGRGELEGGEAAFLFRVNAVAAHYRLTRRESEVLPYLARGRSAKVIAEALFVSENTVRSHIGRIFDKTDLHSKQELIDLVESF